jgi:ATP-dependent helicase HrpA
VRRRRELKLIITSATIDTEKFSAAFNNAPVIEVSGRMYPVEVRYQDEDGKDSDGTHIEIAGRAVDNIYKERSCGDILVFMPTEQDIRETCEILAGRNYKDARILPLFARLTSAEQVKVFSRVAGRKIVVATNVAETSITIPGIKYVVDTGLARISRYSPRTRTTSLPVSPISKSSADQRKGRCGRVENGVCIRLFPEEDYDTRPVYTPPEILRSNLAEVVLRMIALNLGDISLFPFIDSPPVKSIKDGVDLLFELGAIAATKRKGKTIGTAPYRLTDRGKMMAKLPIDPRLSRMLLQAQQEGCFHEMVIIASALTIQDPRERPVEKAADADQAQKIFQNTESDFLTLLTIWKQYHNILLSEKTSGALRRFCKKHFLSYMRMREWKDIVFQIRSIFDDAGMTLPNRKTRSSNGKNKEDEEQYRAIHRSILSGFLSNIAEKKDQNIYKAAKGREVMVFPGSSLFGGAKKWIVAAEMVETSRLFARYTANIDPPWLLDIGRNQCRYTYHYPRWDKSRQEVIASEQVSLYGLIIVPERPVSYGKSHPKEATDVFIRDALVAGGMTASFDFLKQNNELVNEIQDIENRIRRRDVLIGEEELVEFYKERLSEAYDVESLKKRIEEKGSDDFLKMSREFLLQNEPEKEEVSLFPDSVQLGQHETPVAYQYDPGKPEDGVTVKLPVTVASAISPDAVDWLVPGLFKEKLTSLIKGLPKSYRKRLVPISHVVDIIDKEMPKTGGPLVTALSRFIFKRFAVDIPATTWSEDDLPEYLKMRISLTDTHGKEIQAGRDKALLTGDTSKGHDDGQFQAAKKKWEKKDIKRWDFGELPEIVEMDGKGRTRWVFYPGLDVNDGVVNLHLFRHREKALRAHKKGVQALYSIVLSKDIKYLRRILALSPNLKQAAGHFGGLKEIENQIFESILSEHFGRDIRSELAFTAHAESIKNALIQFGKDKQESTTAVLRQYHETRDSLSHLETANKLNPRGTTFIKRLRDELSRLVPANFVELYDAKRLMHIVRYIKAAGIRAQKGLVDFERDNVRTAQINTYTDRLAEFLKELSENASDEKRQEIEDFFWLIEEYKVSLFAQELKTAVPVSKKRLDAKVKEIQRMV